LKPGAIRLVEVATSERRWTGVAVSQEGRIFVNYPLWAPSQPFAVGEIQADGSVVPYPNRELNSWQPGKLPRDHFVCVQAMTVDAENRLWILDPGNPRFQGVVEDGPKLVIVDLSRNVVIRTYGFDPEIARADSYLNDVRVDLVADMAYMTDSGNGALVVLDLTTGKARRLLDDHPSTQAEDIELTIGGVPWAMKVHADGIALSKDGQWLYYQALTSRTLYRIATADLRDQRLSDQDLPGRVEKFAESGASDGLIYGPDDHVYVSALEHDAIRRVQPDGTVETVIQDDRISWPDSFALGPGNVLYFTTARIHEWGRPSRPFAVYRLEPN
jgi:sugar lactone lactonase YvrE